MRNFSFVLWMLLWPFLYSIQSFIEKYFLNKSYSDEIELLSTLISFVIWIIVGAKIYERKE